MNENSINENFNAQTVAEENQDYEFEFNGFCPYSEEEKFL